MIKFFIFAGLIFIPFYEIIIRTLPNATIIITDSRIQKEQIALWIATLIILTALYQGKSFICNNKWLLAFIVACLISIRFAPPFPLSLNSVNSMNFWMWKELLYILIYILFIIVISNLELSQKTIYNILNCMVICATVMSGYVVIQALDFDQFWFAKTLTEYITVTKYKLVGNLGQPTLAASFIALMVPIAFAIGRPFIFLFLSAILILLDSKMALLGALVGMIAYGILRGNKIFAVVIIVLSIIITSGAIIYRDKIFQIVKLESSGRFDQWSKIYKVWKEPVKIDTKTVDAKYTVTGFGPGSFPYVYPSSTKSLYYQAHNEYLEILFNYGIIGLTIVLMIVFSSLKPHFLSIPLSPIQSGIVAAIIVALGLALGAFFLRLGAHAFYLAILFGLLNNRSIIKWIK